MGANLEWDCIPLTLTTLQGSVAFNTPDVLGAGAGGFLLLRREGCKMGAPLRVTTDDVPASDGTIVHRVLRGGYAVNLTVELWQAPGTDGAPGEPATGATLVALNDLMVRHLVRMLDDGQGRLSWNPSGDTVAERMVDDLFWTGDVDVSDDALLWALAFGLQSPFPYAMDLQETTSPITDGGSVVLTNVGTSKFWPVIKAYGPATDFTITNDTTGKVIHYDSSQPGASAVAGGHYIEFDCFRNTAYLDGDVANRRAGVDPLVTEFWALELGANTVSCDGCDVDVLWQPAWA